MNDHRSRKRTPAVKEPVQVHLDGPVDPSGHPALRIAGIINVSEPAAADAAREHDRVLTETEQGSWAENEIR